MSHIKPYDAQSAVSASDFDALNDIFLVPKFPYRILIRRVPSTTGN